MFCGGAGGRPAQIGFDKLNDMVADAMRSWLVLAGYKQLYQEESQHGPDTHAAASLLNNVACLLKNQGKTAEAEKLFLRAIRILEKVPCKPDAGFQDQEVHGICVCYSNGD